MAGTWKRYTEEQIIAILKETENAATFDEVLMTPELLFMECPTAVVRLVAELMLTSGLRSKTVKYLFDLPRAHGQLEVLDPRLIDQR